MSATVEAVAVPAEGITPRELERRYGTSASTWLRWARQGRLRAYKIGPRKIIFDAAEVAQFIGAARLGENTRAAEHTPA